ncbi:hypothetical protein Nepgr_015453 [Nepenthes gracilis]|uniref:Uncharacterized protein n=1 Tax=Nepenthes gracilis TaxID=150966 RepID=A0AAD3SM42_NEPGR|nr:hypothetical protein Nepgr_015453 [Nepenthes gracilis]
MSFSEEPVCNRTDLCMPLGCLTCYYYNPCLAGDFYGTVNYGGNEVAKTVDIEVAYHWRPVHHVKGRTAYQKCTKEVLPDRQGAVSKILTFVASAGEPESLMMVLKAELSPISHVVSFEHMLPSTPPALNHDVAKGLVLDVIDSDNSFTILQDSEDLEVKELHCGPPDPVALITNDEIPTKIGSVLDCPVELTCAAPDLATGNKPVLPLDPLGLALDSLDVVPSFLLGDLQLDTSSRPADEKVESSCAWRCLRSENIGLGSISSKSEIEPIVLAQMEPGLAVEGFSPCWCCKTVGSLLVSPVAVLAGTLELLLEANAGEFFLMLRRC